MDMEPLHFLSFPLPPPGGSTSCSSSLSPGPRPSGAGAGGPRGAGAARRAGGKLSPGGREGEAGGETPSHLLASPWYVAPVHLPLVGQNCWPHMADGFSASLWIRPRPADEGGVEKGRRLRRRGGVLRDSSVDSLGTAALLYTTC